MPQVGDQNSKFVAMACNCWPRSVCSAYRRNAMTSSPMVFDLSCRQQIWMRSRSARLIDVARYGKLQ